MMTEIIEKHQPRMYESHYESAVIGTRGVLKLRGTHNNEGEWARALFVNKIERDWYCKCFFAFFICFFACFFLHIFFRKLYSGFFIAYIFLI